jgi:L-rhamnonate dehydratase
MNNTRIVHVEWATLEGRRPRPAGCNASLPEHGSIVHVPIVRLTAEDGSSGFGYCRADAGGVRSMLGQSLNALFARDTGVPDLWRAFEYPIWDLVGCRENEPVYRLAAAINGLTPPDQLKATCYDTSLYFDDLHLATTEEATEWIANEAKDGYAQGHRAFKIKVGRGARHMPLLEGTERDIAIIRAVSEAVGPNCRLMIDANNGYNLNLAKQVLLATRDCGLFWLEEAFHEDPVLYRDLKLWQTEQGLSVLIADGEGEASPSLLDWAKNGLVDVIQYDIFGYGFTRWLHTGRQLDEWTVRCAPHHYGGHYGNYAACHLAAALRGFTFVEWDHADTPGLDTSAYRLEAGSVHVPDAPGFGLALDEQVFQDTVTRNGSSLRL